MDPTPTALNNSKKKFTMTNLIKILSKTKLSGLGTKVSFAKMLLRDLEKHPERKAEYRFLAVIMEVDYLLSPHLI